MVVRLPGMSGLSPCVRGNPGRRCSGPACPGTIPVCTGEPTPSSRRAWCCRDYPRVYGGTLIEEQKAMLDRGLSPCVRGNPITCSATCTSFRTIPVCTGEPPIPSRRRPWSADYPRVYGGTEAAPGAGAGAKGLSPCVRGNRRRQRAARARVGTIPVCTGEPPGWPCAGCR